MNRAAAQWQKQRDNEGSVSARRKQGRQRRCDNEASGSAMTSAAVARQGRQRRRDDKCRTGGSAMTMGSGSVMTKAEPAARQGRERWRDNKGRTGGATMKGAVVRR